MTLRLETPVLYVHAPDSFRGKIDVEVQFRGGWLTQFYPSADVVAAGVAVAGYRYGAFGPLTPDTMGKLTWRSITVNPDLTAIQGPKTDDPVWLAPRKVTARMLSGKNGESERFLFYRGVGNLDSPLRVMRDSKAETLQIGWNPKIKPAGEITKLWLADIRKDGSGAFRALKTVPPSDEERPKTLLASTASNFSPEDYSSTAVTRLRTEMKKALVIDGLFADEADALLNTWELSYFKSAGLRLFFLVPHAWIDHVLPLTITVPKGQPKAKVTRVMVGRIEIVSPSQRALLATIAKGPIPDPNELREHIDRTLRAGRAGLWGEVVNGNRPLAEAGVEIPPIYRAYLDLGRFRNALVLDEAKRTPAVGKFNTVFQIGTYRIE